MSQPDTKLIHQEAREKLKEAMLSYPGDPVHVTIYVMHLLLDWNDFQTALGRSSHPSRPAHVSQICDAVDEHLKSELKTYLEIQ